MSRFEANPEAMYDMSQSMGELSVFLTDLGIALGDLNSRAESFIANWFTQAGRAATGMILGSRIDNEDLTYEIGSLCIKLAQAADNYVGADRIATKLLAQYEKGLPSGWAVQDAPTLEGVATAFLANHGLAAFKKRNLNISKNSKGGVAQALSYFSVKFLFGAEEYLDIRGGRGDPYKLRKPSKAATLFDILLKGAGAGASSFIRKGDKQLSDYLKRHGFNRNLDHSEVIRDEETLAGIEDLVIPTTALEFAANELVLSRLDDKVDSYMTDQGRVVQYQGIVVQLIENADGVQTAIVYISGTDSDSPQMGGDPATWAADVAEVAVDPNNPLSEGTASMQLVAQALEHAGVPDGTGLILAGFSKGGATAFNFAHNKEMQGKYQMRAIYDQAGPTGNQRASDLDIPHIKVADGQDFVSVLGGNYSAKQRENMIYIPVDSARQDHHSYQGFYDSALEDPAMQVPLEDIARWTADAHLIQDSMLVAGSTQAKERTQEELNAYRNVAYASAAYEVLDWAEEVLPQNVEVCGVKFSTRIPSLPDLPALVTEENTAGDYFEATYQQVKDKPWDSTPPTINWSIQEVKEQEKAYEFTLGPEEYPHLDLSVDSGNYSIDFNWGENVKNPLEKAYRWVDAQLPELPEAVWEVPSTPYSELETAGGNF